jgi:hypothetical protein
MGLNIKMGLASAGRNVGERVIERGPMDFLDATARICAVGGILFAACF